MFEWGYESMILEVLNIIMEVLMFIFKDVKKEN